MPYGVSRRNDEARDLVRSLLVEVTGFDERTAADVSARLPGRLAKLVGAHLLQLRRRLREEGKP